MYVRKSLGLPFQASMDNFEWDFIQLLSLFTYIWAITMSFYICDTQVSCMCSLRSDMYTERNLRKSGMRPIVRLLPSSRDYQVIRLSSPDEMWRRISRAHHRTAAKSPRWIKHSYQICFIFLFRFFGTCFVHKKVIYQFLFYLKYPTCARRKKKRTRNKPGDGNENT